MSVWTDALENAYDVTPDWDDLSTLISTRARQDVSTDWLQATIDEAFAQVMLHAPCREEGDDAWEDPSDFPESVASILASVLVRMVNNPDGVRTVQMGEFSQTWAGSTDAGWLTPQQTRIVARAAGCSEGFQSVSVEPTPLLTGLT